MLSWSHNETSKGGQHSEKIWFFRDRLFHQAANACSEVVAERGPLPLPPESVSTGPVLRDEQGDRPFAKPTSLLTHGCCPSPNAGRGFVFLSLLTQLF